MAYLTAADAAALSVANQLGNIIDTITNIATYSTERSYVVGSLTPDAQTQLTTLGYTLTTNTDTSITITW